MAKKETVSATEESERQSRKEVLRARKEQEQLRNVRIGVGVALILILAVLAFALVNEFFLTPQQPVATVNGQNIALTDWQERVKFERAQRILTLENQLEMFGGDVGLIQQFSGQSILELQDAPALGEAALSAIARDEIVRQAAEQRGLVPTEEDIDARIAQAFNYFDGGLPTPQPTATATVMPTPSITPIPDPDNPVVEAPAAEVDAPPTVAPPTATPVSAESFQQEFGDLMAQYRDLGVSEQVYRTAVAGAIMSERLAEALAIEQELPTQAEKANSFLITFATEEEAQQALQDIRDGDFLTVWNTIRSQPAEQAQDPAAPTATELPWSTKESIASGFGDEVAEAIFLLPPEVPSDVIEVPLGDDTSRYVIAMVNGRELRDLSPSELQQQQQDALIAYVDTVFTGEGVNLTESWRNRVPTVPLLDAKFLAAPTATPPAVATVAPATTE